MTTVVHIRAVPSGWQTDPRFVYIGRKGRGLIGGYGNPHEIGFCRVCKVLHSREESIAAFERDAVKQFESDPAYRQKIERLRDKALVCFCAPKVCHGLVYVKLLDKLYK